MELPGNNQLTPGKAEALGIFVGNYLHSLDPKKRLTIPSDWRDQVGSPGYLFVLPGLNERCLHLFTSQEMKRRLERIRDHSITDVKARQFARVMGSKSDLIAWDSQGRIRIKDELLEYAGLTEQIHLVGVFERFELWNPERWKESATVDQGGIEEAARYVGF